MAIQSIPLWGLDATPLACSFEKVANLFIPGMMAWNTSLIRNLFQEVDLEEIVKIPLSIRGPPDRLFDRLRKIGQIGV